MSSVAPVSGRPVAGLDRAAPCQKSLEICQEMGFVELADFLNWPASSWEKWSCEVLRDQDSAWKIYSHFSRRVLDSSSIR